MFTFFSVGEAEKRRRFRIQRAQIFEPRRRPNGKDLELDPSQCAALYAALTQKISVIQGPPGTGKTYLGLRIVQALLKNKRCWMGNSQSSPTIAYPSHLLHQSCFRPIFGGNFKIHSADRTGW